MATLGPGRGSQEVAKLGRLVPFAEKSPGSFAQAVRRATRIQGSMCTRFASKKARCLYFIPLQRVAEVRPATADGVDRVG